jgi:phage baseplate assembly protein W
MAKVFSYEDANLDTSIRVTRKRLYSDIDLSLNTNIISEEGKGDIYKKTDAAAVKQSIKNLLMTNRFEKPYRPAFGANLGSKLFELIDEASGNEVIDLVKKSIERYEPRAKILNIKVFSNPDNYSLSVTLEFRIINTNVSESLSMNFREPFILDRELPATPTPDPEGRILLDNAFNMDRSDKDLGSLLTSGGRFITIDTGLRSDRSRVLIRENNDDLITTETGLPINIS